MRARYGSAERYLEDNGLEPRAIDVLRAALLEDADAAAR
jgi:hypothetical protein